MDDINRRANKTATSVSEPEILKCQSCGQSEEFEGVGNLPIWQTIMCEDGEVIDYNSWDYNEGPSYDEIHCKVCEHVVWRATMPVNSALVALLAAVEAGVMELRRGSHDTIGEDNSNAIEMAWDAYTPEVGI